MSRPRFPGQVAVVTGASGEIGAAVVDALVAEGATVYAADIRPVADTDTSVRSVVVDVTDSAAVDRFFAEVMEQCGRVDLLVNGAGGPGTERTAIDQVSDAAGQRGTTLNLDGTFHCCRAAVRAMKTGGGGAIVNISSGAGRTYTRTGVQSYAAAKAGVIGLTRQLAHELGPHSIRVNCVAPGLVLAEPTRPEWGALSAEAREKHLAGGALRRRGEAADLPGPVLFFLSSDARYVTGQTISVDGGSVMLG